MADSALVKNARDFVTMCVVQFASYLLLTVNFRAIDAGNKPMAAVTDALCVMSSYFIVKKIAKSENYWALAGMVLGGACAAWVGITLTEGWE